MVVVLQIISRMLWPLKPDWSLGPEAQHHLLHCKHEKVPQRMLLSWIEGEPKSSQRNPKKSSEEPKSYGKILKDSLT